MNRRQLPADDEESRGDENPFASQYVRPGAMGYRWPDDLSAEHIVARLQVNGWWGQITGPHGSGKTSLLVALEPSVRAAGRHVRTYSLHADNVLLPQPSALQPWTASGLVVVDGYEQLSAWQRFRLKRHCRRAGCGLLVTAHSDVGLPSIACMQPTQELAWQLAKQLQQSIGAPLIAEDEVRQAFLQHQGDMRETLFRLYDVYERRRRARL